MKKITTFLCAMAMAASVTMTMTSCEFPSTEQPISEETDISVATETAQEESNSFIEVMEKYKKYIGKSKDEVLKEFEGAVYDSTFSGGDYFKAGEKNFLIFAASTDDFTGFSEPLDILFASVGDEYIKDGVISLDNLVKLIGTEAEVLLPEDDLVGGDEMVRPRITMDYGEFEIMFGCDREGNVNLNESWFEAIVKWEE